MTSFYIYASVLFKDPDDATQKLELHYTVY